MAVCLVVLSCLIVYCNCNSQHEFLNGKMHSARDDHIAFLGEEMAKEFEHLTPEEAKRRLR